MLVLVSIEVSVNSFITLSWKVSPCMIKRFVKFLARKRGERTLEPLISGPGNAAVLTVLPAKTPLESILMSVIYCKSLTQQTID